MQTGKHRVTYGRSVWPPEDYQTVTRTTDQFQNAELDWRYSAADGRWDNERRSRCSNANQEQVRYRYSECDDRKYGATSRSGTQTAADNSVSAREGCSIEPVQ